jgi:hypothetical protein
MSGAWQRYRIAEFSSGVGLKTAEELFLQTVVRLADTTGVLTDSALATRTASFSVPWLASLVPVYKSRHLKESHFQKALTSASSACARLSLGQKLLPTAHKWKSELSTIQAGSVTPASVPVINIPSAEVINHQREVASLILLGRIASPTPDTLNLFAAEVALGLISRVADPDLLITNLRHISATDPTARLQIVNLLCSPGEQFKVIVSVIGAEAFESIEKINPSAQIRQLKLGSPGSFAGWGNSGAAAGKFIASSIAGFQGLVANSTPEQKRAFLGLNVVACDIRAAATIARRTVMEALDQYVAGHPFVLFELDNIIGVARPNRSSVSTVLIRPPIEPNVRPLAIPWPLDLRQAMRVAHLLREATAPMTRVALAWVLIESTGHGPQDIEAIAKTVALKVLRQKAFMAYRFLVQEAFDREPVRYYRRRSSLKRASAKGLRLISDKPDTPTSISEELRLAAARADFLSQLYGLLGSRCDAAAASRRSELDTVNRAINPTASVNFRAYLQSEVLWLLLLRDDWHTSAAPEALALRNLLDHVGLPVKVAVEELSALARSGTAAAKALTESHEWWIDTLNAFYAARNMHLHSGVFSSEGDTVLGVLAVTVSDALFESWGTWYGGATSGAPTARQITLDLAARYDVCIAYLKAGRDITDIDLDHVTSPGWTPVP